MRMNSRFKIKSLIAASVGLLTILFYQNCSTPVSQSSSYVDGLSELDIAESKALTILTTKCSSCHNMDSPAGGIDVLSLDQLLASGAIVPTEPGLSPLFNAITSGSMPPSKPLAQEDIMVISDWILKMSKDMPVDPGPGPIALGPTYKSIYANILKDNCLGCHNSTKSDGGVSFSSYNSTFNTVSKNLPMSSSLYTSIAVRNTMPKGQGGSLSADQKTAVFNWITAGAADN